MADPADEYIRAKADALAAAEAEVAAQADAIRRLTGSRGIQQMYRHVGAVDPRYAGSHLRQVSDSMAAGERLASEGLERASRAFEFARQNHPVQVAQDVARRAAGVNAPDLSPWQWWQQNPSILTAVPLSQSDRTARLQEAALLEGLEEADRRFPVGHPYNLYGYGSNDPSAGVAGDRIRSLIDSYSPEYVDTLRSPYRYRQFFRNAAGEPMPLVDRQGGVEPGPVGDALTLAGAAMGAAAPRWLGAIGFGRALTGAHDSAIPALQQAYQGDLAGLGQTLAQAPVAALNPSMATGRRGGPADWRRGVPAEISGALDVVAGDIMPWFVATPSLAAIRPAPRADEIRRLTRELARRYHPDLTGGSDEMMRQINKAAAGGDLRWLRALAR